MLQHTDQPNTKPVKSVKGYVTTAVAGVAGVALLAGGATFALWSDDATVDGATIGSGSFSVATDGVLEWSNASTDEDIDLTTYAAAPGESVSGVETVVVELDGNNIEAQLTFSNAAFVDGGIASGSISLRDSEGELVGAIAELSTTDVAVLAPVTLTESGTYTVVVEIDFAAESGPSTGVDVVLSDIDFSLTQVDAGSEA